MEGRILVKCVLMLGSILLCSDFPKTWSQDIDKPETKTYDSLRGKWLLQSREVDGKRLRDPDGVFKVFTDDRMMKSYAPGGSIDGPGPTLVGNVHYRIYMNTEPGTIDAWGKKDMTDVTVGIFRVENDTLTICWAAKTKPRPTKFSTGTGDGDGQLLSSYKRMVDGR